MFAYAAIPLTCWLASVIAEPRSPLPGNDVEERVYIRLFGRQHLLRHLAIVASVVALFAAVLAMPSQAMPGMHVDQATQGRCTQPVIGEWLCSSIGADGEEILGT